jgi:hypothetical protein
MNPPTTKQPVLKPRPIHTIRHGAVKAAIWREQTAIGPRYNITFSRSYKAGEEWKSSSSFGRNNLLALSLIATRAYEWIEYHANTPKH